MTFKCGAGMAAVPPAFRSAPASLALACFLAKYATFSGLPTWSRRVVKFHVCTTASPVDVVTSKETRWHLSLGDFQNAGSSEDRGRTRCHRVPWNSRSGWFRLPWTVRLILFRSGQLSSIPECEIFFPPFFFISLAQPTAVAFLRGHILECFRL